MTKAYPYGKILRMPKRTFVLTANLHSEKEELQISFVKWKEHFIRRTAHMPPFVLAFGVMAICLVSTLAIITEATQIVYVSDSEGQEETFIVLEDEPEVLMTLTNITVEEGDSVSVVSYQDNHMSINIQRAFAVTVRADDANIEVSLIQGTVADALALAEVSLGEYDYTTPSLNTTLSQGDVITVHRVEYIQTVEYEPIPYETEYVYTSLYFRWTSKQTTVQEGSDGQTDITSTERWVDGALESSQISSVVVSKEPTTAIYKVYGAKVPVSSLTGPDGTTNKPSSYTTVYTGRSTGYYSSTGKGSSGLGLGYGTVAVDPNLIPYGTLLYIESTDGKFVYGYAIATDTGTALMNGTCLVDCFYETYAESTYHWAQTVNVYVVG
ncbi:MAG: 3D domain-containing protein [Faecalibacterium sp.]